jgi:hypothetical protein
MAFSVADIADAIEEGLATEARRLDREQAVRGLDACEELELHPVLAGGLRAAGYVVWPEQHYPLPKRRRTDIEGERCDLVLAREDAPLDTLEREPTLFDPPKLVPLDEAFWLEVKVVAQHTPEGPNARYASQLLSEVRQDVSKLSRNPGIHHAALALVLFCADDATADHDLAVWLERCLDQGLPVGSPCLRRVPITDRLGNTRCVVAVYPVG